MQSSNQFQSITGNQKAFSTAPPFVMKANSTQSIDLSGMWKRPSLKLPVYTADLGAGFRAITKGSIQFLTTAAALNIKRMVTSLPDTFSILLGLRDSAIIAIYGRLAGTHKPSSCFVGLRAVA